MTQPTSVRDHMTTDVIKFHPQNNIYQAVKVMSHKRISGAPVLDDYDNLVGVLSQKDCLRIILDSAYSERPPGLVSEYMSTDVETVEANTSIFDLVEKFCDKGYRRYPVMDHDHFVGIISRHDIIRAIVSYTEEQYKT